MKSTNGKGGLVKKLLGVAVLGALFLCLIPMAGAQSGQGTSYVALGDSISSGYGLEEGTLSFAQRVAQDNGLELTNLAQDGETATSLLDKLQTDQVSAAVAQADIITITVGGNDLMNALYAYLTDAYNQRNPETPTTQEEMKSAVMGGDMGVLTFALEVGPGFSNSERAIQALADFHTHLTQMVLDIRAENPQVQLVVVEQYNPYSYLVKELSKNPIFASSAQSLCAAFGAGVADINNVIAAVAQQQECWVAKVYDAFETAQENPCNASVSMPVKLDLDFHPNAYGHALIAQQVTDLLAQQVIVSPEDAVVEDQPQEDPGNPAATGTPTVEEPDFTQMPAPPVQTEDVFQVQQPPATGDTSDLVIWMILMCISGACLVVVTISLNRRKGDKHES